MEGQYSLWQCQTSHSNARAERWTCASSWGFVWFRWRPFRKLLASLKTKNKQKKSPPPISTNQTKPTIEKPPSRCLRWRWLRPCMGSREQFWGGLYWEGGAGLTSAFLFSVSRRRRAGEDELQIPRSSISSVFRNEMKGFGVPGRGEAWGQGAGGRRWPFTR